MATQPIRILLVDDDKICRFTTNKLLNSFGLPVDIIEQSNGREALDYLRQHADDAQGLPDVIFLDLNMPVMDGWEFLSEFNKAHTSFPHPVPICIVSSSIDSKDTSKVAEFKPHVFDYLVKPVPRGKFSEIMKRLRA